MQSLLKFLMKFFLAVINSVKLVDSIIEDFPTSLYSLQKLANLDKNLFIHIAVPWNL